MTTPTPADLPPIEVLAVPFAETLTQPRSTLDAVLKRLLDPAKDPNDPDLPVSRFSSAL